jgi:integrase
VTAEQLQARITPKQATPFFLDKLVQLTQHIDCQLSSPTISPIQRFILVRDQAYFTAMFFSGDRPGDLGQVKVPEILRFPNDDGLMFNHIWGKMLRDGDANVFGIRRNPNITLCPVAAIERYIAIASTLQINLKTGYLFRPTTPQNGVQNCPLTSSTAEARLKLYLKEMGADDGETLHGFRAGCAVTLALSGVQLSEIMDHVGWSRRHTALYYLQLVKVLNPMGASAKLASQDPSQLTAEWTDMNQLKRFVCAFPVISSAKRSHTESLI